MSTKIVLFSGEANFYIATICEQFTSQDGGENRPDSNSKLVVEILIVKECKSVQPKDLLWTNHLQATQVMIHKYPLHINQIFVNI